MLLPSLMTPEMTQLTLPEERELITELAANVEDFRISGKPAYRPDLPHHNNHHVYEEVLPEGIRLVGRDSENNTPRNRLIVPAAIVVHDMGSYLALDPQENFATKEERTAAWAGPLLLRFLDKPDTEEAQGAVLTSAPGSVCKTPNERKVRRADISNVGSPKMSIFLATTVRLFHEEVILAREAGEQLPEWKPYLDRQHIVLRMLLAQDLSVAPEITQCGIGPFNRQGIRNANMLHSKHAIRTPDIFTKRGRRYLLPLVPDFDEVARYIKGEVTS